MGPEGEPTFCEIYLTDTTWIMYFVVVANDNSTNCSKYNIKKKDYFGNPPNTYLQELIKNDQFLDNTRKKMQLKKPHLLKCLNDIYGIIYTYNLLIVIELSSFLGCQVLNFLSLIYIFVLCIKQ